MNKTIKILAFAIFAAILIWISRQHNYSYAAAPYSNIITVLVNSVSINTNAWPGPTNNIYVNTNHYFYQAYGGVAVTGFVGANPYLAWGSILKVLNSSGSNIEIDLPTGIRLPLYDPSSIILTNNDVWIGSFDYSDNQTNVVYKVFH